MTLSFDELRSGLALEKDLVLPTQPTDPEMRESTSIWMFDETGTFGFPRMGIEAEASSWNARMLQMNIGFADGRFLDGASRNQPQTPIGPDGQPTTLGPDGRPTALGAGGLIFRCIEPFRRWTVNFEGMARDGQGAQQLAGTYPTEATTPVRLEAELTMVAPAWTQELDENDETAESAFMGLGFRFEQLFRADGVLHVNGEAKPFKGTGIRVKRQSIRRLEGFYGHCWQSALFPDGRGFCYVTYPPKADGSWYRVGYIYQDGKMYPAKVVTVPYLHRLVYSGEDVSCEIEYELGRVRIQAESVYSASHFNMPTMAGFALHQAGVRFNWDGQTAIGMMERSTTDYVKE